VEWVVDRVTGNRKGFCFVIFADPESVEEVTDGKIPPQSQKHEIKVFFTITLVAAIVLAVEKIRNSVVHSFCGISRLNDFIYYYH
jgi:hypothetical protein